MLFSEQKQRQDLILPQRTQLALRANAEENIMQLTRNIRPKEDLFCPYGNAINPLENFGNLSREFFHYLEKDFIIFLDVPGFQEQILSP